MYQWSIRIKRSYAVLNVHRERDIVRPPAPIQITPELPTATAFYSGILYRGSRNLVGSRGSRGNADLYYQLTQLCAKITNDSKPVLG